MHCVMDCYLQPMARMSGIDVAYCTKNKLLIHPGVGFTLAHIRSPPSSFLAKKYNGDLTESFH